MALPAVEGFQKEFGSAPRVVTRAPGRLEILGNHTDYNEGVVLSTAVDRSTWVAAAPADTDECVVKDVRDESVRRFRADALDNPEKGDWANYIKGIVVELQQRGIEVPPFQATLYSTVPMSAGMSSSAAMEMSFCFALGRLAGADLPWLEWARIGQGAENNYVGAKTGLMDQFSSLKGMPNQLVFSDFRSLEVRNVPLPEGTALVVANSKVKHELTNEYNERRERCEEAVEFLQHRYEGISALRDVSRAQLDACKEDMDILVYRRALHVVGENERVFAGSEALKAGDLDTFGKLMVESQASSRDNFENSCRELDILVDLGRSLPGFIGARLSGGGFGGITVHLVRRDEAESYAKRLGTAYKSRTDIDPETMICQAGPGAEVIRG